MPYTSCKVPCKECPFLRNSLPGYIGGHSDPIEILDIVDHDEKFPCHTQVNSIQQHLNDTVNSEDEDDPLNMDAYVEAVKLAPVCVGSLIYLNNHLKKSRDPRLLQLQVETGKSDKVFKMAGEFLEYHGTKHHLGLLMIESMKHYKQKEKLHGSKISGHR